MVSRKGTMKDPFFLENEFWIHRLYSQHPSHHIRSVCGFHSFIYSRWWSLFWVAASRYEFRYTFGEATQLLTYSQHGEFELLEQSDLNTGNLISPLPAGSQETFTITNLHIPLDGNGNPITTSAFKLNVLPIDHSSLLGQPSNVIIVNIGRIKFDDMNTNVQGGESNQGNNSISVAVPIVLSKYFKDDIIYVSKDIPEVQFFSIRKWGRIAWEKIQGTHIYQITDTPIFTCAKLRNIYFRSQI